VGYGQNGSRSVVKKYSFDFDLVFDSNCSQEDVFLEVSALIQSALDGYNVCIFAYGQTGYVLCVQLRHSVGGLDLPIRVLCRSGKTYTMELSADMGIVGRAISHIFAGIEDMRSSGWHFTASLELVEIYNETLRDLLAPVSVRVHA